ncbi:MAG: fused MFS/spermidine synthase [Syntrophobacteraceae bacterium]
MIRKPDSGAVFVRERIREGLEEISYACERIVYGGRSSYQEILIVDTLMHGRMLMLDGVVQSCERDEFIYHEMLVHPALFSHERPKSVLVIGGAEGATIREVLRHPSIERVVMVDIDGELVAACRKHLPSWHRGSFDDPRVEIVIDDARAYVTTAEELFDGILVDLSDPDAGSPALLLFTQEFYGLLRKRLAPKGCLALQGEGISPQDLALHARMVNTLRCVFERVHPYMYTLPSFHRPDADILVTLDPEWSLDLMASRAREAALPLNYCSPEIAAAAFCLPPYLTSAYGIHRSPLTDSEALHGSSLVPGES